MSIQKKLNIVITKDMADAKRALVHLATVNNHNPEAKKCGDEPKELAVLAVEQTGVDYSILVGKPHPQPSDCLCFYQMAISKATRTDVGKRQRQKVMTLFLPCVVHNDNWLKTNTKIYLYLLCLFCLGTPVIP